MESFSDIDNPPSDVKNAGDGRPTPTIYAESIPSEHIDPDAVKVIRRLTRYSHQAYLVGGGVRDLLLGRQPKDFDIATSARPQEVKALFRNCRIIGRRFRLAHILFGGGKIIEVATFRKDPMEAIEEAEQEAQAEEREELSQLPSGELDFDEADRDEGEANGLGTESGPIPLAGRRRADRPEGVDLLIRHDNVFGEPHEDAIRRDFTINGLFYDIEREEVIDYVGGVPDVRKRVVRTIGDPDVRFREDPVRILRAIKFSARCDLGIAPEVYDAMVDHRLELERAAKPRLLEEVLRLLRGGAAHRSIWLAWDSGVLHVILPELAAWLDDDAPDTELLWGRLAAVDRRVRGGILPSDPVLFSTLVRGPLEEAMEGSRDVGSAFEETFDEMSHRLAVPRRLKDRMRLFLLAHRRLRSGKLGTLPHREFFADAAMLYAFECEARGVRPPDWAIDPEASPLPDSAPRPRRRRRRR